MSFLTDLFEGQFGNLGTDLSHAPSSFAAHPQEQLEVGLGAAAVAAPFLLPEIGGALGAGAGADVALGADAAAGGFDIAGAGLGADVLADPAIAGLAGEAGAGAADAGILAGDVLGGGATSFAPDVLSADAGSLSSFLSDPAAATSGIDTGAGGQDLAALAAPDPAATATAPPPAPGTTPGGFASTDAELSGGTTGTAPASSAAPSGGTGGGGLTSGLGSVMSSPWTKLGLGLAPLALTLGMGEAGLTPQAQQAAGGATQLQQFGQQQLADAQAGRLNAGQTAVLGQMRQDLTNQWKQVFFNMGVQDPTKDTRWAQALADIDQKVTAQTATVIQQMITNGLQASGQASQTLIAVANQQIQSDTNFTNNLIGATKALGTIAGGGQTITLKAA
jgi:hypothetical protein